MLTDYWRVLRRRATAEFSPAFQRREKPDSISRRVSDARIQPSLTRRGNQFIAFRVLKPTAKFSRRFAAKTMIVLRVFFVWLRGRNLNG
ncbi:MAG: hypothetical protein SF097_03775 [Acidobacteriota bacterium]|nr:hypothetical protein [Acidobacteriota bacterium]